MTYPSFSAGDILTAADMNAVGLWLIKTQTIGTAVSSVEVTGAFSSTYDNYKIIVSGGVASTDTALSLRLGASTTGYYANLVYATYAAAGVLSANSNNATAWVYAGVGTANSLSVDVALLNPFNAKTTSITAQYMQNGTNGSGGLYNGYHNPATSYTAFTLFTGSGTMTGGTIRVYGYRN